MFGVPSSAQWMARRYQAPSLTVIFDNQGWKAPSLSTLAVHPSGGGFAASFAPAADLAGVAAAAGGAYACTVAAAGLLAPVLEEALDRVRKGQSAVVSVQVPPV
jgi:acetolactate synthase-1/2/3 large subunit